MVVAGKEGGNIQLESNSMYPQKIVFDLQDNVTTEINV